MLMHIRRFNNKAARYTEQHTSLGKSLNQQNVEVNTIYQTGIAEVQVIIRSLNCIAQMSCISVFGYEANFTHFQNFVTNYCGNLLFNFNSRKFSLIYENNGLSLQTS